MALSLEACFARRRRTGLVRVWPVANMESSPRNRRSRPGSPQGRSNWRIRSERWKEVQPGVYLIGGAPRTSRGRLMAACLWGGPTAVASHRAAGYLWNLAGVETGFIEIAVDRCLRSESVIVHRLSAPPQLVLHRDSIPVCDPTTTIFQLAAVLPTFSLEVALDCAMRLKLTHLGSLNDHLDQVARSGRNGISIIRRLLANETRTKPRRLAPSKAPKPIDQEVWASASCSAVQSL
jgi:hypothetical protein